MVGTEGLSVPYSRMMVNAQSVVQSREHGTAVTHGWVNSLIDGKSMRSIHVETTDDCFCFAYFSSFTVIIGCFVVLDLLT